MSDTAEWQEAALSSRHMHNRVGKHGRGKCGKSGGAFDVRKAFGTYEIKCPFAAKLAPTEAGNTQPAKLEIYTLNNDGNALLAELYLPHVLHASVLLTGSRKTMNSVLSNLETDTEGRGEGIEVENPVAPTFPDPDTNGEGEHEQELQTEEDPANRRVQEFEKNSFRSPKFWLRWQGQLFTSSTAQPLPDFSTDSGYVIFSGNNCDKFQGTISCKHLGWDNVKISGWKTASRTSRNFAVVWQR